MKIPMPAAVLAGGASRRMGVSKAALPYGTTTLLAHQTRRLAGLFEEVVVAVKETPEFDFGPARIVVDSLSERAPLYGLLRALEETQDRIFVLAVDLPLLAEDVIGAIARRGLETAAPAVVPEAAGLLQPLAAVWRRSVLAPARERMRRGEMSLHGLARAVGAEIFGEQAWRALDTSGNSFANVNTVEAYVAARERA